MSDFFFGGAGLGPGRKSGGRGRCLLAWLAWAMTLLFGLWLIYRGAVECGYSWDWSQAPTFFFDWDNGQPGPLLRGLALTLQIIVFSLFFTFLIGSAVALARIFGGPMVTCLARIYLEIVRNTPLLVQLALVYFVLGPIFQLSAFWAAVLTLSLFEGAYLSEIIRSGLLAVDEGQWQAAWCLGLSTPATLGRVILPQTGPMLLPPLASLVISLIKDSALASSIAVYELTKEGRELAAENFQTFEVWLIVAGLYLSLNLAMSMVGGKLESRFKRRAGEGSCAN